MVFTNNGLNVISGGHDGAVKVWDMRNFKSVAEIKNGHQKKYEEAVMCLTCHSSVPFFASGGADCLINIYELNLN